MSDAKPPFNLSDFDFGNTLRGHQKGDRVFDRFVLQKLLGRGGMGVVWLALDERLGREVALKFAPEVVRFDDIAIEELKEETRKGLDLAHPNIVKTYDFLLDEEHAAISMEFIDGETLSTLRLQQPNKIFEPEQIRHWVLQLLDALEYAHGKAKVIHRDLKPANLMVERDGQLRVTDFGIARSISDALDRATMGGASTGTLAYMSPQQAAGKKPSIGDDIYAVGSTLYELLTGKPPFFSGNIARQLSDEPATSVTQRRQEFGIQNAAPMPEEWEQTVLACLAKETEQRPQSIDEIRQRLLRSIPQKPKSAVKPPTLPASLPAQVSSAPAVQSWSHSNKTLWLTLLMLLGLFLAYKYLYLPKPPIPQDKPVVVKPEEKKVVTKVIYEAPPEFTTIQAAINQAKSGDTVTIPAGTYDEQIRFKNGINLKAAVPGQVRVQTDGKAGSAFSVENCSTGSISGFVFQHTGNDVIERISWPVVLIKSSSIVFTDNTVQSGVGDGLWLSGAGKPVVKKSAFRQNAKSGVVIETGSNASVTDCESRKNGGSGVEVRLTGTSPTLKANTCTDNGGSGIVVKDGASANILEKNQMILNTEAGIAAVGAGVNVKIESAICDQNLIGITIQKGAKARIADSTITSSFEAGIHFDGAASGSEVTGNTIEKSKFDGLMLTGEKGSEIIVTANKSRFNGFNGILVFGDGFKPTIETNLCEKNGQHGILATEGTSGTLRDNTAQGNNLSGVAQEKASADLVLQGNVSDEGVR
jgi:parallel beta-helix repeat protein